jgi:hypothetical protein
VTAPRRREKRIDHLDARIVPVEAALLARAEVLESRPQCIDEIPWRQVAAEFRELAESLHWFG